MFKFVFRPFPIHNDPSDFGPSITLGQLVNLDGQEIMQITMEMNGYYHLRLANGVEMDAISILHIAMEDI